MEDTGLCGKIEEKMAECRGKCVRDRDDPFLSIVWHSELEMLEAFYDRIRKEGLPAVQQADLRERLAELEKEKKKEEEHPSFDWYDEHYHYKVLEGQCAAYKVVLELLEKK